MGGQTIRDLTTENKQGGWREVGGMGVKEGTGVMSAGVVCKEESLHSTPATNF